jgi:hypothetical protein
LNDDFANCNLLTDTDALCASQVRGHAHPSRFRFPRSDQTFPQERGRRSSVASFIPMPGNSRWLAYILPSTCPGCLIGRLLPLYLLSTLPSRPLFDLVRFATSSHGRPSLVRPTFNLAFSRPYAEVPRLSNRSRLHPSSPLFSTTTSRTTAPSSFSSTPVVRQQHPE